MANQNVKKLQEKLNKRKSSLAEKSIKQLELALVNKKSKLKRLNTEINETEKEIIKISKEIEKRKKKGTGTTGAHMKVKSNAVKRQTGLRGASIKRKK